MENPCLVESLKILHIRNYFKSWSGGKSSLFRRKSGSDINLVEIQLLFHVDPPSGKNLRTSVNGCDQKSWNRIPAKRAWRTVWFRPFFQVFQIPTIPWMAIIWFSGFPLKRRPCERGADASLPFLVQERRPAGSMAVLSDRAVLSRSVPTYFQLPTFRWDRDRLFRTTIPKKAEIFEIYKFSLSSAR